MFWIYLLTGFATIALSFWRWKSLLHPHLALSCMLVYMFHVDFLTTGNDHDLASILHPSDWTFYQYTILCLTFSIWLVSFYLAGKKKNPVALAGQVALRPGGVAQQLVFGVTALAFLSLEVYKRLSFSDWSLLTMLDLSFGPRGTAPWYSALGNLGDATFKYQVVGILVPVGGMLFAYLASVSKGALMGLWLLAYLGVLLLLVSDGSRTTVYLVLLSYPFCLWHYSSFSRGVKAGIFAVFLAATLALGSAMYQHRDAGFADLLTSKNPNPITFAYHQDDNFYQAVNAMDIAKNSEERWAISEFWLAILVNPVPRYYWPDKPALLSDYWGTYKNEWTTITWVGEMVAMFGVWMGIVMAICYGILAFVVLNQAALKVLPMPAGLIAYSLIALYVYMTLRSLLNISHFVYMPLLAYGILLLGPGGLAASPAMKLLHKYQERKVRFLGH